MNLRIDFPRKTLAFVDSLPHLYLFTCISALWNGHVKLRPLMFAASVAGASVSAGWYCKKKRKDVQNSTLNQRSYIWILVWTLCEEVRLACVQTPGLFFGVHVPVMTHRIRQK